MAVAQRDATVTGEVVGEVRAYREVELRPQVSGTVRSLHFKPGQHVQEGELLFVIDPRAYEASLAKEQAALADAQATLARARQDVERYKPLLPENAIPRATYDAAVAEVHSPVTGQIGLQQVEIGGLATAQQTVLAVVSTVDPVYVEFSVPEADYVRGAEARKAAGQEPRANPVTLTLPDGSEYPQPGRIVFAERAISGATGTLAVRAQFENPQRLLRPGMNVRVRLVYEQVPNALLVPQRAVTELLGRQFVTVVGAQNKAEQQLIAANASIGAARALFFPRISLTGLLGRASDTLRGVVSRRGRDVGTLSAGVSVPIFTGGSLTANYEAAQARAEQAALGYRRTIVIALQEVSDALVAYEKDRAEADVNRRRVEVSRDYLRLANLRFRSGVVSYLEVLDTQRQLLAAELNLNASELNLRLSAVQLYRALGGGWQPRAK